MDQPICDMTQSGGSISKSTLAAFAASSQLNILTLTCVRRAPLGQLQTLSGEVLYDPYWELFAGLLENLT